MRFLAAACALSATASVLTPAHAGSINTSAVECTVAAGAQADISHDYSGVGTPLRSAAKVVNCSVPRSPLSTAPGAGTFQFSAFIRNAGAAIDCTLYSYDYTGAFLGSVAFRLSSVTPATNVLRQTSLPPAQLGFWAYTSMSCTLPGNAGAFLTGVLSTF
jgi:hypothetical protein